MADYLKSLYTVSKSAVLSSQTPMQVRSALYLVFAFALGALVLLSRGDLPRGAPPPTSAAPAQAVLPPEFERLREVYAILQSSYVEPQKVDPAALTEGAIRGMLQALDDPYTAYIEPRLHSLQLESLEGSFGGIGAVLSLQDGRITVVAFMEDTPAARGGLRPGDIILQVDGVAIDGMGLTEVILRIRGAQGTPVRLLLRHRDASGTEELELVRDRITVKSVRPGPLSRGIPLLKLSTFSRNTGQEMKEALQQIDLTTVPGIVIDLRNNTGGLLDAAIQAVSSFLGEGVILYQVDRNGQESAQENKKPGVAAHVPLALLVNSHSASASEIFAGAVQDHRRGVLVGEQTFGKGSVGLMHTLSTGGGLVVTTARWLTPNHRLIEGQGLEPDLVVTDDPDTEEDEALQRAIDYLLAQSRS